MKTAAKEERKHDEWVSMDLLLDIREERKGKIGNLLKERVVRRKNLKGKTEKKTN